MKLSAHFSGVNLGRLRLNEARVCPFELILSAKNSVFFALDTVRSSEQPTSVAFLGYLFLLYYNKY